MAGKIKTVDDLISDVRSMLDEDNNSAIDTDLDILPALNRAQDTAANILARQYESPLLSYTEVQLEAGQREYDIPENSLEERLEKVEVKIANQFYSMTRVSYRDIAEYETDSSVSIPSYYCVIGDKIRLAQPPTGAYSMRMWYLQDPLPLVVTQGRITKVQAADNFILVDTIGADLTTETDTLNSYITIVDGDTGILKGSFQIKSIADTKITFKSTPSRTTVYSRPISDDLAALVDSSGNTITVNQDDLICLVKGTCVPFMKKPLSNFLIQYAVAELTRKLGGAADMELRVLKDLEAQVERSWVGRELTTRVKMVNNKWARLRRRFWR